MKIVKTDRANDNKMLNGVVERRDSSNTLLMEVQMIFAELFPNSFGFALCMIYHN